MGDKKEKKVGPSKREIFRPFDKDISLIVKCLLKGNPLPKKRETTGQSDRDSIDSGVGSIPDEEVCTPGMYNEFHHVGFSHFIPTCSTLF